MIFECFSLQLEAIKTDPSYKVIGALSVLELLARSHPRVPSLMWKLNKWTESVLRSTLYVVNTDSAY